MTTIYVFRVVLLVWHQFKRCVSISNTALGPSGHSTKPPPSSRLETLYSCYRQWFITKIHVLRLVLFVRRQSKRWGSISNTTMGPSGHGKKPPSSRLRTLYSHYRQWFMAKIHELRIVLFVRRQFELCVLISNTTLGPSGSRPKPPSSRLRTLYSYYRQCFMTKIHVFRVVLLVRRQFKHCVSISNTIFSPSGHVWSHHRWGWGPCAVIKGNGLWHKSMYLACFVCLTSIQALGVDLKHHTGPQWPWCKATILEAGDFVQLL